MKLKKKVHLPPPVMCCMSCVTCHMSHVINMYFFLQSGKDSPCRVAWTKNSKLGIYGCLYQRNVLTKCLKLAEGTTFLVYSGIYNGKNLQNLQIFFFGTKTPLYELIYHQHLEDDKT